MTHPIIKILLIDDHALFRSGLKFLLETEKDFEIVGEAQDGLQGVKLAGALHPDIILLDLDMPVMAGKETLQQLLNTDPTLKILILTVSEDDEDLLECMKIGAKGYLLKNIDTDFLLNSIRKTLEGNNILSPEMTTKLIGQFKSSKQHNDEPYNLYETLTPREKEILAWLTKGVSNKEIARFFNLSESTIKLHVQNILRKLNIHSRVQAAVFALEHGFNKI
ncbi:MULTISPECIES: response regulator [Commensalibacter]|uniref:Nitrate/nitrite response regulator protein narL n=2 Tax=Commensalibacter TaxID=1079922 RepID=W7E442_9PROT|nr:MULTISPECIES: response regulator transcription factor [Commensalibacter]EUK17816.1 nitrate/nitrite response regulator protein narL [Commensalibacter papalotli (ex Servin-Garciduenas et al. 2014)]CAI3943592.1 DNA-binding response regulator [Commensalibacter papalotli (ex Botero et al. 2024)]CAI3947302.1 DNA-binding response regulator [Commensalibacter papalotli (ex Botero et al. 2024)]